MLFPHEEACQLKRAIIPLAACTIEHIIGDNLMEATGVVTVVASWESSREVLRSLSLDRLSKTWCPDVSSRDWHISACSRS